MREYQKPMMKVETFTSNEFISACWYVESGNCYDNLCQDLHGTWGIGGPHGRWNPQGGDLELARNHGTNHRLPESENNYFKVDEVPEPQNINNDHFYDYPNLWSIQSNFHAKITTPIYSYTSGGTTHYFKAYKTNGHS